MTDDIEQDAKDQEIDRLSQRLAQSLASEAQQRRRIEELERENRQLGQFAHMVSHDLRAPLRHVITLAGFLREDAGDAMPAAVDARLDQIEERARSMMGLVEDLLEDARGGTASGPPALVDLQTLVSEAIGLIGETGDIDVTARCDVGMITTDTTPLATCVRNLIDNAVKHHPGPTGTVTVEARTAGDNLVIQVTDDGAGIDPVNHTRIFEPMWSLGGGTGLGLSTVDRILSERGGSIALDADLGRGATFTITWPLLAEPVLDLASPSPPLVATTSAMARPAADDHAE